MSGSQASATVVLDGRTLPDRKVVGGKAWSIAHMMKVGLQVPPAFVVTAPCNSRYQAEGKLWPSLIEEIRNNIRALEQSSTRSFGGKNRPLLLSVRSGAAVSMPGMMDTVLNLGMNDEVELALGQECGDPHFAKDTHRRFLQLFSSIVLRADLDEKVRDLNGVKAELAKHGLSVPADPYDQLFAAVAAVFESWNSRRAKRYRDHHGIAHDLGTAVTLQAMVFGNLNDRSGTGVLFSRNPLTGERKPYGEFLRRAQGEDVVSGRHTPQSLDAMEGDLAEAHAQLLAASEMLEEVSAEVQDIEFTVEDRKLFILQSRSAKLAPQAVAKTSVDFVSEGRLGPDAALRRISPDRLRQLLAPSLRQSELKNHLPIATGEGACPGVGIGRVVCNADEAEERIKRGESVILARPTTSPNDLHGMIGAVAVITEEGGTTSHAAVVSRSLGVPCVVGCGSGSVTSFEGQSLTVDGQSGAIYKGELAVDRPDETRDPVLNTILKWANVRSPLKVLRPGDVRVKSEDVLDLDMDEEACDAQSVDAALQRLMQGRTFLGARGGAIATNEGVRAALRHKLDFIVAEPVLPALVAAVVASR